MTDAYSREYIRVRPTSEELSQEVVPQALASLHKLKPSSNRGVLDKLNPLSRMTPPRFEFLAISEGKDEPVEFYYGVDDEVHLGALEKLLRSIYPSSFTIERTDLDVAAKLISPTEYTPGEFIENVKAGKPLNDALEVSTDTNDEATVSGDGSATGTGGAGRASEDGEATSTDPESVADGGVAETTANDSANIRSDDLPGEPSDEVIIEHDGTTVVVVSSDASSGAAQLDLAGPTVTEDGTVLARPAINEVSPVGVRWYGLAPDRKRDWMTSLDPFTETTADASADADTASIPTVELVEYLTEAASPTAFHAIFERRPDWSTDAELREEDLRDGRDTRFQRWFGEWFEIEEQPEHQRKQELSPPIQRRIDRIHSKTPKRTFTVNLRVVAVPPVETAAEAEGETNGADAGDRVNSPEQELDAQLETLCSVFDRVDGPYYGVDGRRLRSKGFRQKAKEKHARKALKRLLDRELVTGRGKRRPDLVLNGNELANFIIAPSSTDLTKEGTRGTRAEQQSRTPLPLPHPDLMDQFRSGALFGHALTESGTAELDPTCLPAHLLTSHFAWFGPTGFGKTVGLENVALSLHREVGGPVIMADPKGGAMCRDYLHAHYKAFGTLDDVYYFRVPDILPAFSFFAIRPAVAAGRDRTEAIEDKVEHFHELLRLIMGEDYEAAYVGTGILTALIMALFDPEYGSDAYGLDDLSEAAREMQEERTIPMISDTFREELDLEERLTRHFNTPDHEFHRTMRAVRTRLEKLKDNTSLYRIFRNVPEWDDDTEEYVDPHFDFRQFLDEDVVILFDLGTIRPAVKNAITMVLLSHLWDAMQVRFHDGNESYDAITNLILEESSAVASTTLMYEQLLPESREFGLSVGLAMQYPGQVREESDRAYEELKANVHTTVLGRVPIDDDYAKTLTHEDLDPIELRNRLNTLPRGEWIIKLPEPAFQETGPLPFHIQSAPIPDGHPESDTPLEGAQLERLEGTERPRLYARTEAELGIDQSIHATDDADHDPEWGSRQADVFSDDATTDDTSSVGETGFLPSDALRSGEDTELSPSSDTDENGDGLSSHSGDGNSDSEHADARDDSDTFHEGALDRDAEEASPDDEDVSLFEFESRTEAESEGKSESNEEGGEETVTARSSDLPSRHSTSHDEAGKNTDERAETADEEFHDEDASTTVIPDQGVRVSNDQLQSHGITHDEAKFLAVIVDAMNGNLSGYSLRESMTTLADDFDELDVQKLIEQGFLEENTVSRRKYYTVLPAGRELIDKRLDVNAGTGDLGEKTPHKVGVELLCLWLDQQVGVARTEKYYEFDADTVFDVVAFDADDRIVAVGETETPSNNSAAVVSDYEKLAAVDAMSVWAVSDKDTAEAVLKDLVETGIIDMAVGGRATQTMAKIQETVIGLNAPGIDRIKTFSELDREIDT